MPRKKKINIEAIKYDGLLEIRPEEIEEHKKIFVSKEKDGKTYFPFEYINVGFGQRCYGFIKLRR
jgi:hypothetical protein